MRSLGVNQEIAFSWQIYHILYFMMRSCLIKHSVNMSVFFRRLSCCLLWKYLVKDHDPVSPNLNLE